MVETKNKIFGTCVSKKVEKKSSHVRKLIYVRFDMYLYIFHGRENQKNNHFKKNKQQTTHTCKYFNFSPGILVLNIVVPSHIVYIQCSVGSPSSSKTDFSTGSLKLRFIPNSACNFFCNFVRSSTKPVIQKKE